MDAVFNKWWLHALMKPSENGLLSNCSPESNFTIQLAQAVKVLKAIFYDKPISESTFSPIEKEFIIEQQYFLHIL